MIGCNDGSLYGGRLTWIWVPGDFLSPIWHCYITTLIRKLLDFCVLPISPTWDSTPKFPNWKGCCKVTTMETVVSGQLTAVLSRGATGLQSQSLDLPEFDDQSTFAAKNFPTKISQEAVFSDSFVFTQIRPNWKTELHKGVFFHAQNPLHRWSWCLLAWNASL